VDVVINHMTADYPFAVGVCGTTADTYNRVYPCVPYGPEHFNTPCAIIDWNNKSQVSDTDI
jgi:hypothetical protein